MPRYDYSCEECNTARESRVSYEDRDNVVCPVCLTKMKRLPHYMEVAVPRLPEFFLNNCIGDLEYGRSKFEDLDAFNEHKKRRDIIDECCDVANKGRKERRKTIERIKREKAERKREKLLTG